MATEPQYLYLTTIGRKTGRPHEIEIWFVEHEGRYYLVSEGRTRADWVQNIQQNPAITFRVGETAYSGQGRVVEKILEQELGRAVSEKMDTKYRWSEGLIVELDPEK
jgi:deazaflavin-dependent oxidoreductase (nitroreductase family)